MDSSAAQTRPFLGVEKRQEYWGIDRIYINQKKFWDISEGIFLSQEGKVCKFKKLYPHITKTLNERSDSLII